MSLFPSMQLVLVASLAMCTSAVAQENESAVPLALGLESVGAEVGKVSIRLDGRDVTVSTLLKNYEPSARKIGWYASTPQFSILGVGEEHVEKSFADVRSTVNGKISKPAVYRRGYFMGRDVTPELTRVGLEPLPNLNSDAKKIARLRAVNTIKFDQWQGYSNYTWTTTIPPESSITLKVHYRALPEFSLVEINSDEFDQTIQRHCGDKNAVRQRLHSAVGAISQVIIESYEVPIGYVRMRHVEVNVVAPGINWLRAHPLVSMACGLKNEGLLETISGSISNVNGMISILVVSAPQKLIAPDEGQNGR